MTRLASSLIATAAVAAVGTMLIAPVSGSPPTPPKPATSDYQWHEGPEYDVQIRDVVRYLDRDQYHGEVNVVMRNRATGQTTPLVGEMKLIGNFSPIWIKAKVLATGAQFANGRDKNKDHRRGWTKLQVEFFELRTLAESIAYAKELDAKNAAKKEVPAA